MTWVSPVFTSIDSFILLADNLKVVQQVDVVGALVGGFWVSSSYARGEDSLAEYTIKTIAFEYVIDASPANIKVFTDPDGTSDFILLKQIDLVVPQIGKSSFAEVFAGITGKDPRVKLEMNPSVAGIGFSIRSIDIEVIERARL